MAQTEAYLDPERSLDERVDDLLARMTPPEKAGLMFHTLAMIPPDGEFNPDLGAFGLASIREMTDKHMTHFNLVGAADAKSIARWANQLQELAAAKRLAIPVTLSSDPRHSFDENPGAQMATAAFSQWPEPPGLAAIGDEKLAEDFADIARQEYLAVGLTANFGASDAAALDIIFGRFKPTATLPFELPSSMAAVRAQQPDLPHDSADPLFPYGFGLRY